MKLQSFFLFVPAVHEYEAGFS